MPIERSRTELEALLVKHGATAYVAGWQDDRHVIKCQLKGLRLRFDLAAPSHDEFGSVRRWQAEERRRWRALVLHVKSKLEIIESGDADFETEFLGYLELPSGETVASRVVPELERALQGGKFPPLLPG